MELTAIGKNHHGPGLTCYARKLFLIMRMTVVLLLITVLQLQAKTYSQKISLSHREITVEKAFHLLKQQTGFSFLWNDQLLSKSQRVSVHVKDGTLEEALRQCLRGLPLTFRITDGIVYIIKNATDEATRLVAEQLFRDVSGVVRDTAGHPLAGVAVTVKGVPGKTVATNAKGEFTITSIDDNAILIVSFTGYTTVELKAANAANVVLREKVNQLNDVVITGYQVQERRAITGSIAQVKGEAIENVPLQSFDKAIQGRAAGVLVQTSTGVPGGAVRVNIRGVGSIGAGTTPLYIVDGVQLNVDPPSERTSTNALAYLNPNDIESIEILKDAAAAAIYGAQAANGVVLISTKKGKAGKSNVSLNYYEGISAPIRKLELLTTQEAIAMRRESVKNANPTRSDEVIRAAVLQEYGLSPDLTDEEVALLPTYDWQGETFQIGNVRNIEGSVSGGTGKTTYYVAAGYNRHKGNVTRIDFNRSNFKLRLGHEISKRLSFDVGINLSMITQNGNTGSQGNTTGSAAPQYTSIFMPPSIPVYNADGTFNVYNGMPGTGFNPIQAATVDDNIVKHRSLVGHVSATYKIFPSLTFKSFFGMDYRMIRSDYYRDPRTPNGANVNGYLIVDNSQMSNFTTNHTLQYSTSFGSDHSLSAILGAEYRKDERESNSARGQGFPTYQYRTLQSAAEAVTVSGAWTGFARFGFYSQANYAFRKRYYLSSTLRYDGSSRFGADNRMGFFPGVSAGWDLAAESFMRSAKLDQLKIRVGYGSVGNEQISNTSSKGLYQGGSSYNGGAAISLVQMANRNLGWEKNVTTNVGVDFSLFDHRISGTAEVFRRVSTNMLMNRLLPPTSGFSSMDDNLGSIENRGLEFSLNTENIRGKDFKWSSNFNITFIRNKILELYDGLDSISGTIRADYPLFIYYRPRFAGVNSANGRPMWYDKNGNITYLITAADNVPTGKGWLSDYFGGLTNTFSYKGFELVTLFHFDMGRYLVNQMGATLASTNGNTAARNTLKELYENRWVNPGQVTWVPRLIEGGAESLSSSQQTASTRFLEDASFIRLREVTFSYRFSPSMLKRIKFSSARVYLTAVNLYTWTKWSGFDPEIGIGGSVETNQGIVPQTMSFTAGIQLGF